MSIQIDSGYIPSVSLKSKLNGTQRRLPDADKDSEKHRPATAYLTAIASPSDDSAAGGRARHFDGGVRGSHHHIISQMTYGNTPSLYQSPP